MASLQNPASWRSFIRSPSTATKGGKQHITRSCLGPKLTSRSLFYSQSARWRGAGGTRPQPFSKLGGATATRRSISSCFSARAVSRDSLPQLRRSRSASLFGYSNSARWCHTRQNSGVAIGAAVRRRWMSLSLPRTTYHPHTTSCATRRSLSSLVPRSAFRPAPRCSGRWEVVRQRRWASQPAYRTVQQQKARYRSGVCIFLRHGVCSAYVAFALLSA